jgi:hypothetical protein
VAGKCGNDRAGGYSNASTSTRAVHHAVYQWLHGAI